MKKVDYGAIIFFVLVFAFAFFVVADTLNTVPASYTYNEDISWIYNISVYNSATTGATNFTQVNLTFPAAFTLQLARNGTDSTPGVDALQYTSATRTLSWTNATDAETLVPNGSNFSFWVNATVAAPGEYNITVSTLDTAGKINTTYVAVSINDTTIPNLNEFSNLTYYYVNLMNASQMVVNVTANDNYKIDRIVVNVFNSSDSLMNSTNSGLNVTSYFINYTIMADGLYKINASANDSNGNTNYTGTGTYTIRLDKVAPVISFGSNSIDSNNSYVNRRYILINISATDGGSTVRNITIFLYNSTATKLNITNATVSVSFVNYTDLPYDGVYTFNASVDDYSGNVNWTVNRIVTVDTTLAKVANATGSDTNGSILNRSYIFFNASITETNPKNITLYLYNSTGSMVNSSSRLLSSLISNNTATFTRLRNGNYSVNVSVFDQAGNENVSVLFTMNISDTATPLVLLNPDPMNNANISSAIGAINFTFNITDDSTVTSCTLYFNGAVAQVLTDISQNTINGMYNSSLAVGTYDWDVNCTDVQGNVGNSSTRRFWIYSTAAGGDDGNNNGGGGGSIVSYWAKTIKAGDLNGSINKGQLLKKLKAKYRLMFNVNGFGHSVGITNISSIAVTIMVNSTPQYATMKVGETKKFDLDADGYYDLSVRLVSLVNGEAELAITEINEKIPTTQPIPPPATQPIPPAPPEPPTGQGLQWLTILLIVVIVVVAAGIIAYYMKSGKKSR